MFNVKFIAKNNGNGIEKEFICTSDELTYQKSVENVVKYCDRNNLELLCATVEKQ